MWDNLIQYLSVGTLTLDGKGCTDTDLCSTKKCFDIFTITFNRPIYLQSLGIMGGLKETTDQAERFCYFKPKVIYNKDKTSVNKISGMTDVSINKPADRIELKSQCAQNAKCVFTVETSDVADWTGLMFQGATKIKFYL